MTFDVPGAVSGTFPTGINEDGAVTGGYADRRHGRAGCRVHGKLRAFRPLPAPSGFQTALGSFRLVGICHLAPSHGSKFSRLGSAFFSAQFAAITTITLAISLGR